MPSNLTKEEFAKKIKSKYPEYKDLDDDVLANRILEKYPSYKKEVASPDAKKPEMTKKQFEEKVKSDYPSFQKTPSTPDKIDKLDPTQFAQKIKSKYPEYKDMDNKVLTDKFIRKYSNAKKFIKMNPFRPEAQIANIKEVNKIFKETLNKVAKKKKEFSGTKYLTLEAQKRAGISDKYMKQISVQKQLELMEEDKRIQDKDIGEVIGLTLQEMPIQILSSSLSAIQGQGGAAVGEERDAMDKIIKSGKNSISRQLKRTPEKIKNKSILGIKVSDLIQLPQNLGFSAISMGAGTLAAIPATALTGPTGGAVAAGAASGTTGYRMATYNIMQEILESENRKKKKRTGEELTAQEQVEIKEKYDKLATKHGLWEAIPEAIGTAVGFGAFFKTFKSMGLADDVIAKIGKSLAGAGFTWTEENITETITEFGQKGVRLDVGLPGGEKPEWTNFNKWIENFKSVAPQTTLMTLFMGGGAKATQSFANSYTNSTKHQKKLIMREIDSKIRRAEKEGDAQTKAALTRAKITLSNIDTAQKFSKGLKKEIKKINKAVVKDQLKKYVKQVKEAKKRNMIGLPIRKKTTAEMKQEYREYQKITQQEKGKAGEVESITKTKEPVIQSDKIKKSLEERLNEINKTQPEALTRAKIKAYQQNLTDTIRALNIPAKDKAKLITRIKEANTKKSLKKQTGVVKKRAVKYYQKQEKRDIQSKTKRELKYTKPVKKGQKRVEKFDYERSKILRGIRKLDKLNQKKAQIKLNNMDKDNLSEIDKIKARFLSYKANGMKGSVELHKQVLNDIKRLKRLGFESKNSQDLETKLERKSQKENVLASIAQRKGGKKNILSKATKKIKTTFFALYDMLNAVGGPEIANKYDLEPSQIGEYTELGQETSRMGDKGLDIYNLKRKSQFLSKRFDLEQSEYEMLRKDGITVELSKAQLMDIYNSVKNDLIRERYYRQFGEEQVNSLLNNLTEQDKEFADFLMDRVQSYREILNKRHIEIHGRDLGYVENYWPSSSKYKLDIYEDYKIQGETPSAMKQRSASPNVVPEPRSIFQKFNKSMSESVHIKNVSRGYEEIKRLFSDATVEGKIKEKWGKEMYDTLMERIETGSLHQLTSNSDQLSKMMGKMISNWTHAKIASPTVVGRQLSSMINYSENMPSDQWVKGFFKNIKKPRKTFKYMWKNSPYLKERFNRGFSETIGRAIKDANRITKHTKNWKKFSSLFARSGDVTAIVYGGKAYVDYLINEKGMTKKEAFNEFEKATIKAQQSPLPAGLSGWQRSEHAAARAIYLFKNSNVQAFRKMANASINYANGDISLKQYGKTLFIYGVYRAAMYATWRSIIVGAGVGAVRALLGKGEREDEFDLMDEMFMNILLAPTNAMPIFDQLAKWVIRKAMDKKSYRAVQVPVLEDINRAIQKAGKKEPTAEDFLEMATVPAELSTGLPIGNILRYYEYITEEKESERTESRER